MVSDFDPLSNQIPAPFSVSMAATSSSPNTLPNRHDPNQPYVTLSTSNVIKLHSKNYLD